MTEPTEITEEQIALVRKLLADIQKLGIPGLVAQYAIYANLYMETHRDTGRGARAMRAEQLMPLVIVLSQVLEIPNERIDILASALTDGVVRAAFQAKLKGNERIDAEVAGEAMEWAIKRMDAGEYDK